VQLTGCWWRGVPSVAAIYTILRQQSTRTCTCSSCERPSTLHVSWAKLSPYAESHSAATYTVLIFFQSCTRSCLSPLEAVPVLCEPSWSFSPQCTSQLERGKSARGWKDTESRSVALRPLYSKSTLCKLFSQPHLHLRKGASYYSCGWPVQFTPGMSRLFFIGPGSPSTSHGLMLVRDSMSQCTNDLCQSHLLHLDCCQPSWRSICLGQNNPKRLLPAGKNSPQCLWAGMHLWGY